jgi:hypothetical protein
LTHELNALERADGRAEDAAKRHARALADEASKAHTAAANLSGTGKAAAAAKHAAEVHARALSQEARAASEAATALAAANGKKEKAAQHAADVAAKAADKAKAAWDRERQAADAAAHAAADTARQLVASLQSSVDAMQAAIAGFSSTISSGIAGDATLATLWQNLTGTDANGNPVLPTLSGLQTDLDTILAQAQAFSADLDTLVAEGASQDLISQLAGMGNVAGDALAEQLLAAGPDAIVALQTAMASIQSVADAEGKSLADSFFGPGVAAMDQFIAGLASQSPELRKALAPLLAELAAMFAGVGLPLPGGSSGLPLQGALPAVVAASPILPALAAGSARGSDGAAAGVVVNITGPVYGADADVLAQKVRDSLISWSASTGSPIFGKYS